MHLLPALGALTVNLTFGQWHPTGKAVAAVCASVVHPLSAGTFRSFKSKHPMKHDQTQHELCGYDQTISKLILTTLIWAADYDCYWHTRTIQTLTIWALKTFLLHFHNKTLVPHKQESCRTKSWVVTMWRGDVLWKLSAKLVAGWKNQAVRREPAPSWPPGFLGYEHKPTGSQVQNCWCTFINRNHLSVWARFES